MSDVRTSADIVHRAAFATRVAGGKARRPGAEVDGRMLHLAKLAEIGQLTIGIVHEINNPLGCLRSNVSLLPGCIERLARRRRRGASLLDSSELRDVRELVEDIVANIELVTSLAHGLKSVAYSSREEPRETDLHECIEGALRVVAGRLERRVRIERDFGSLPPMVAYPGRLVQLFLNLLINAADAISGEGVVCIRTRRDGHAAVVEVEDNGSGICAEHVQRVFQPYFTTKPAGVGLGLGLSICHRVVKQHGGSIHAATGSSGSASGPGTVFHIRLPLDARGHHHQQASTIELGGSS